MIKKRPNGSHAPFEFGEVEDSTIRRNEVTGSERLIKAESVRNTVIEENKLAVPVRDAGGALRTQGESVSRTVWNALKSTTGKFVSLILVIGGVWALWDMAQPQVEVEPLDVQTEPGQPLSTLLRVKNSGRLEMRDVVYRVGVRHIAGKGKNFGAYTPAWAAGRGRQWELENPPIFDLTEDIPGRTIEPQRVDTFNPYHTNFDGTMPVGSVDMDVVVSFRVSWNPYRYERRYRFVTRPVDGKPKLFGISRQVPERQPVR